MTQVRKRSPRCPSFSLEEAVQRIGDLYEKENKHAVAADAAAQGLGYKDANSGAAKTMIASVSYYGLLNRSPDGKLSVAPDFEKFKYAPTNDVKSGFLTSWLKNPKVFAELIQKYGDNFPSDGALKYELIEMGFMPDAADDAIRVLKSSVEYVKKQGATVNSGGSIVPDDEEDKDSPQDNSGKVDSTAAQQKPEQHTAQKPPAQTPATPPSGDFKTITIFLPRGREALLYVPRPFFEKDRDAIKRQIDALLTDDEAENE